MKLKQGDKVRIISCTDVDTKELEEDFMHLIGTTATVVEPTLNDYYDCTIQLNLPLGELGKDYGDPPTLAMLYCDLEIIK